MASTDLQIHLSASESATTLTDQLSLHLSQSWDQVPSPKMRPSERTGIYTWTRLYSAFSESFALEALRILCPSNHDVLLDPFAGAGTTLVAAVKLGVPAIGVDLDPFSALLASASVATEAHPERVFQLLKGRTPSRTSTPKGGAPQLLRDSDLQYARGVFDRIRESQTDNQHLWADLLANAHHTFDSELVALAALGVASNLSANMERGSNPVWYRRLPPGETAKRPQLNAAARGVARLILADLARLASSRHCARVSVLNEDFRSVALPDSSVDLVLTSPPYLNRLDYVVNHLAPLTLLSSFIPVELDNLREEMMGTTIVVKTDQPDARWGETCLRTLSSVFSHPSKASATYYYWNYLHYFADLFRILAQLKRLCRPSARGVVVLQNSYYKELEVPAQMILCEMSQGLGIDARIIRTEKVRAHLGTISPRQNRYNTSKVLAESIISLAFQ